MSGNKFVNIGDKSIRYSNIKEYGICRVKPIEAFFDELEEKAKALEEEKAKALEEEKAKAERESLKNMPLWKRAAVIGTGLVVIPALMFAAFNDLIPSSSSGEKEPKGKKPFDDPFFDREPNIEEGACGIKYESGFLKGEKISNLILPSGLTLPYDRLEYKSLNHDLRSCAEGDYLYVTTYQGDNNRFYASDFDIDEIKKMIDEFMNVDSEKK